MRQGDGAVRQAKRTPRSLDFTIEFDRRKKSIGSFNGTYSFSMIICGGLSRMRPGVGERLLGHALAAPGLSLEALFEVTQGVATRDEIYC